jgi:hypothetical protein
MISADVNNGVGILHHGVHNCDFPDEQVELKIRVEVERRVQ